MTIEYCTWICACMLDMAIDIVRSYWYIYIYIYILHVHALIKIYMHRICTLACVRVCSTVP